MASIFGKLARTHRLGARMALCVVGVGQLGDSAILNRNKKWNKLEL